jgi:cyclic pyranopterin phosphate synthase
MLRDRFDRVIDYLRVSVTDRCNFRCVYCMPEEGFPCTPKAEHLTAEELGRLISVAASLGMTKVRLTGGEPLLRKDLTAIVRRAREDGVRDLSATTNGHRLAEMAKELYDAGLNRINVSLDTLRPGRFQEIARRGSLDVVLNGIRTAMAVGMAPLKLNVVALKGINDGEAADFAAWTRREPVHVRFIELMPMRWNIDETPDIDAFAPHGGAGLLQLRQAPGGMLPDVEMRRRYVSCSELQDRIEAAHGPLEAAEIPTNGPARTFRIPGAPGTIGFISQISNDLCERCNRLRLTHDGYLRGCLMSDGELDLRTPLRAGATNEQIRALFEHVVAHKPERHYLTEGQHVSGRGMSQIGG